MTLDPETQLALAGREPAGPSTDTGSERAALEDTLSSLDGGAGAVACSSGPATISTVAHLFDTDAHLICAPDCYGGSELFSALFADAPPSVSYADPSDPATLTDTVRPETEALWVATPSLPRLRVVDLEAIAAFADAHDLLLVVDNTVLSPLLQRPLDHGADLVVYSSLRPLSGHADVEGSAVVAGTAQLADHLATAARTTEATLAPSDSAVLLRGLRTLSVRTQRRETNARSIAYALREHPAVERVCYPGLRSHPDHEIARRQQDGYGGVVSFVVDPSRVDATALLEETEMIAPGTSLDGVATRINHPVTMSHASLSPEQREAAGLTDTLVRLSVGIESTDDLTADLEQALYSAQTSTDGAKRPQEPISVGA